MAVSTQAQAEAGTPFFTSPLHEADPAVHAAVAGEIERLQTTIELIASENIVSRAVLEAQGSVLTNKYAEGYPGRRYYGGCEHVDVGRSPWRSIGPSVIFELRASPTCSPIPAPRPTSASCSPRCQPGDTILGLSLAAGGHLTHGAAPNLSGKWFKAVQYGVRREDGLIDFDEVEALACGAQAEADHRRRLRLSADHRLRALPQDCRRGRARSFMVDMAHFAGLVAAGVHPSPLPHAHVVTTTTHKTLRGPVAA